LSGVPADAALLRLKQPALCLDVRSDVDPEGAPTVQATCSDASSQKWTPAPAGAPDAYTLTNLASGKCLDINGESKDDGAVALQWTCKGSANQQWKAVPAGDGYALVSVNSGKCLSGAGAGVVQLACTGEPTQIWSFAI
jgi:hypothetical protein